MSSILIADDALFMRNLIKSIVTQNDFNVVAEAENGFDAVKLYRRHRPDIVTMDITMPGMNGLDALKEIRAFDPNACVIMVTAIGQESMMRDAIVAGARSFIVKPFDQEILISVLKKAVQS